jgi:multiple sugar transport system substrate-binding protein
VAAALALGLTACGGTTDADTTGGDDATTSSDAGSGDVTLTMSGWSLATTPEFQTLVDGFESENPGVTIEIKEYDPNEYENLMLTDMTSGQAPDIITIKQAKFTYQWAEGGQLYDVSDIVSGLSSDVSGAGSYEVDGVNYAVPYRQDSWFLFYNKDLFDQAGVEAPTKAWTWDEYTGIAQQLTTNLAAAGSTAKGAYLHSWQSTVQGFANAQADADIFAGDYGYMKPFYDYNITLQQAGAQESYGNVTTNKLTYQAQFGKQSAAMMLMGSWYAATLLSQQASGDADSFTWGIAPAPQVDGTTLEKPITFGDPTGMAIYAKIDDAKLEAAQDFLAYIASEKAATSLVEIGIMPSSFSDSVSDAYFAQDGMPTDDLTKFAVGTRETRPENPVGETIMEVQSVLGIAHTSIMSESSGVDEALALAGEDVLNENW